MVFLQISAHSLFGQLISASLFWVFIYIYLIYQSPGGITLKTYRKIIRDERWRRKLRNADFWPLHDHLIHKHTKECTHTQAMVMGEDRKEGFREARQDHCGLVHSVLYESVE